MHSDLNPKNLLLDPDTLAVTGLLDWEFAHAGHPFTDLGNLLRFERDPAFTDAVLAAYTARRGRTAAADALALARAADLWALVDLAARRARTRSRSGPTGCSPGRDATGVDARTGCCAWRRPPERRAWEPGV